MAADGLRGVERGHEPITTVGGHVPRGLDALLPGVHRDPPAGVDKGDLTAALIGVGTGERGERRRRVDAEAHQREALRPVRGFRE